VMLLLEYDVPAGQHLPSAQYTIFGRNFNVSILNRFAMCDIPYYGVY